MNILDEILTHKRKEVERQKQLVPQNSLLAQIKHLRPCLDFIGALRKGRRISPLHPPALIAEVKCASPSRGLLAPDFDPVALTKIYAENGASAISVLTDERYFKGHLDHLRKVACEAKENRPEGQALPVLRKDFIFDPYQVYEARCAGADAVLLIAAALQPSRLFQLQALAEELGMAVLIEVHNRAELESSLNGSPRLVGINNRNLRDFSVDLETTLRLRASVPDSICLVSESGIHTPEDIHVLGRAGVDAVLVGEALVTAPDVPARVRSFAQLPFYQP
jgi:indole-3-glycerol phosphate synthase